MIILGAMGVVAVLLWFFGFPLLVSAAAMYALRPPKYRDPDPTPPEAFYGRLSGFQIKKP